MLADPCGSQLMPGFYGSSEGYLSKFHSIVNPESLTVSGANAATCGCILWAPDFTCQGLVTSGLANGVSTWNMLTHSAVNPAGGIDLRGYVNDGQSTAFSSNSPPDPAYPFVSGTVCDVARTVSACMRMSYLGAISTTQGAVAVVDIPFSVLENKIRGDGLSVNDLFVLSHKVQRMSLDSQEIRWTPGAMSETFRNRGAGVTPGTGDDFLVNVNAGTYTLGSSAVVSNPRIIGFAWKGLSLTSGAASDIIQFDCFKNIEWKPQGTSGLSVPRPVRTAAVPPAHVVTKLLDDMKPDWRDSTMKAVESGASRLAKKALANGGKLILKSMPKVAGFLM